MISPRLDRWPVACLDLLENALELIEYAQRPSCVASFFGCHGLSGRAHLVDAALQRDESLLEPAEGDARPPFRIGHGALVRSRLRHHRGASAHSGRVGPVERTQALAVARSCRGDHVQVVVAAQRLVGQARKGIYGDWP